MKGLLRVLKKDIPIPTAVGLEWDGEVLIKPFYMMYLSKAEERSARGSGARVRKRPVDPPAASSGVAHSASSICARVSPGWP